MKVSSIIATPSLNLPASIVSICNLNSIHGKCLRTTLLKMCSHNLANKESKPVAKIRYGRTIEVNSDMITIEGSVLRVTRGILKFQPYFKCAITQPKKGLSDPYSRHYSSDSPLFIPEQ